jgi:hypothetical protein
MAVKTDSARLVDHAGGGLAQIVEENGEDKRQRGLWLEQRKHQPRVDEDIPLGVKVGGLVASFQLLHFRKDHP